MKTPHTKKNSSGYVILFAILLVSIILSIAIGIASVALKEVQFTVTARDAHISFFAADTGGECALFYVMERTDFATASSVNCGVATVGLNSTTIGGPNGGTKYTLGDLSVTEKSCARVSILMQPEKAIIESYGYNMACDKIGDQATLPRRVERLLTYELPISLSTELPPTTP